MKKILSIDGGGIKGVFPAAFLAALDDHLKHDIASYFDLIAGTSTGGIIALGLGLGFSPREILAMYESNASTIFPSGLGSAWSKTKRLNGLMKQRYDTEPLADILRAMFRDKLLGQSNNRLMICATDLTTGKVNFFKTAHHERLRNDYKISAKEIALATSAAPVFFKPHTMPSGQDLVDGAMWANNPVGPAAVEAVHTLGWEPEEIAILSLSCTGEPASFARLANEDPGAVNWGMGLIECFMASQSSASYGTAINVLGDNNIERIKRIEPIVEKDLFTLDGTKNLGQLKGLGENQAKHEFPRIKDLFFDEPAPIFVPEYKL
ncbi:CBASS cGAMP-activated phospholipase [uncultured Pseudodesulfovibrio sp.]|uniref:CBASS cGAMP-activated phospholipase n=1 Tax=uncultured Pseudodesulfovibrio sp. TaxID=2035858 RepID=UPI0029C7B853|nr:CBASS cGAMP-activated phospholipase [uncultured Pseudodesulfovibrio sp.]